MVDSAAPSGLLFTDRGDDWLRQFADADQDAAALLVSNLTLISHSEFERGLQSKIEEQANEHLAPVAFFAVREVDGQKSYFTQSKDTVSGNLNALAPGNDHGSEARIAAVIRNLCKTCPKSLLNHPDIEKMRAARCRTIVLVDDFIGSGNRILEFINAFLKDATFASWHSLKYTKFVIVTYSGTNRGVRAVERHKSRPQVVFVRRCPTVSNVIWSPKKREVITHVCKKYGAKTSKRHMSLGYSQTMGTMVFEHGCPNNVPSILWAPTTPRRPWRPLFPNRVVLSGEKSIFPPEVAGRDLQVALFEVGQPRLASSIRNLGIKGPNESMLLILAFIAKGQRKRSTLSFATGLDERQCEVTLDRCFRLGFVSETRRLTAKGKAELIALRRRRDVSWGGPEKGSEYYYPSQLRRVTRG
ncbi:phosphoribosyltransferase-like protein [Thalassospira sp. CH_XMU1448-2]|uniref:phosphoribosyltransferase-like protein n=1 Tax=Thalassospira sp. CH_XMU1448-2 TaxID=3107773 RepID=UPI00300958F6